MADNIDADEIDFDNSATTTIKVSAAIAAGEEAGLVTSNTVPETQPIVTEYDSGGANSLSGAITTPDFSMWTDSEYPRGHIIYDSVMLTASTSLATFTKNAALWNGGDPKWLKAQKGLTVPQILTNLSNLASNCWEPIFSKYPNAKITNTFRQGASQSQHGNGQAMDIQFKSISPSDYFVIAQWVRDNVSYDQLLLEKAANAPWIHISFYSGTGSQVSLKPINRVATMLIGKPTTFTPGLQQVA